MKEQEPIKETFPVCAECHQDILDINPKDDKSGDLLQVRYKGEDYHNICLRRKLAREEESKETIVFEDKGLSELSFMRAMEENRKHFNKKKDSDFE